MERQTLTQYPHTRFSYKDKVYVAEASDFGASGGPRLERIYDDACDVGFQMIGKTGAVATFYLSAEHRGADQDITHWVFLPTTESLRRIPALRNVRVEILND